MIVKIMGGLGNQMFQYAFAKALQVMGGGIASNEEIDIKLDVSVFFNGIDSRTFGLSKFDISLECLEYFDRKKFFLSHAPISVPLNIFLKYFRLHSKHIYKYYIDDSLVSPNVLQCGFHKNSYFEGYFQHKAYFECVEKILRDEFCLKNSLDEASLAYKNKISNTPNSCLLHIRRGDYLNASNVINLLEGNYYNNALKLIKSRLESPHIFVFSDDIAYCKENLFCHLDSAVVKNIDFHFVENAATDAVIELELMKACQNAIIANSTFSIWAAYLMNNPSKIIIAPKAFFYNDESIANKLYPSTWIKCDYR